MTAAEVSSVLPCAAFDISTTSLSVLLLDCRIHVWLNHLFIGCNIVGKEKNASPTSKVTDDQLGPAGSSHRHARSAGFLLRNAQWLQLFGFVLEP